jgi:hypothetical protein
MSAKGKCEHLDLHCHVSLDHVMESGVVYLEAKVHCNVCGIPFEFQGLTAGLSAYQPHCDVSAQELRAPMFPKGCKIMPGIPGFSIKAN